MDQLLNRPDLPQPIRWRLLTRLVALGFAGSHQISAEQDRDPDPDADWQAAAARAATPTGAAKDAALDQLLTAPGVPTAVLRPFGTALWQPRQTPLLATRAARCLERLVPFAEATDWFAAARVVRYAFPMCAVDKSVVGRLRELAPGLAPVLTQAVQDQAELAHRALTAQHLTAVRA